LYKNNQIKPTDTDERIVGKKYTTRRNIVVFVFLSKNVANKREREVCKTTTTKANLKLLPTTFRKRSSLVAKYVKFRAPINSGGKTPSQRFVEFQRLEIDGYKYKNE
jgi:hypothetical protein